jgi:hypothetical protein
MGCISALSMFFSRTDEKIYMGKVFLKTNITTVQWAYIEPVPRED